jgi:hypothetical protein
VTFKEFHGNRSLMSITPKKGNESAHKVMQHQRRVQLFHVTAQIDHHKEEVHVDKLKSSMKSRPN